MEVHNTVPEVTTKTSPKKKGCKKAKWVFETALQIAEKRTEEKARRKGKIHPTECRVPEKARRGDKAFLCEQCKKTKKRTKKPEENNRIGKTRDLFRKIEGNIFCKDGHNEGQK